MLETAPLISKYYCNWVTLNRNEIPSSAVTLFYKLDQGVLRLIWSGRLECVFVDPKGAKISKNGNKITCRLSKNKQFLFYTQGRGGNIMPATPS